MIGFTPGMCSPEAMVDLMGVNGAGNGKGYLKGALPATTKTTNTTKNNTNTHKTTKTINNHQNLMVRGAPGARGGGGEKKQPKPPKTDGNLRKWQGVTQGI